MDLQSYITNNLIGPSKRPNARKISLLPENIKKEILNKTKYLPIECKFNERIYCILNDITSPGKCNVCGKPTKFITFFDGYRDYCSNKCINKSKKVMNKRRSTNIKKYGGVSPSSSEQVKKKIKNTNRKKYGCDWYLQTKESISNRKKNSPYYETLHNYDWLYKKHIDEKKNTIEIANLIGATDSCVGGRIRRSGIDQQYYKTRVSSIEKEIVEFLDGENMFRNGFRRFWDCGHNVYLYK